MNHTIRKGLKALFQNPGCQLEELFLADCSIDTGEACALSEVLLLNKSLKKLALDSNPDIEVAGWKALGAVWARPNCVLEELHLDESMNDDECAVPISAGLAKNTSIKVLSLSHVEVCGMGPPGWQAFFNHLRDASFQLEKFYLDGHTIGDEGVMAVNMLARMPSLKALNINHSEIYSTGWLSFCNNLLRSDGIQLTELCLHGTHIFPFDEESSTLASLLVEQTSLEELDLGYSIDATSPGWDTFFESLDRHTSLVRLDLTYSEIDDEAATILAEALASSAKLKEVWLEDNNFSAARFVTVLRNPNSALEDLRLEGARIDDAGAVAFARALADNTTLTSLSLGIREGNEHDSTTQVAIEAFAQLLCSKSSVMDTLNSNHTLQDMGRGLPDELVNLLSLNKMSNKREVARRKILNTHFTGNDMDIQVLVGMELNVLPDAMAWAGRDSAGRSLLYKFVRGIPSLIECGNAAKCGVVSGKRKRAVAGA